MNKEMIKKIINVLENKKDINQYDFFQRILLYISNFHNSKMYCDQINSLCDIVVYIISITKDYEEPSSFKYDDNVNEILRLIIDNNLIDTNKSSINLDKNIQNVKTNTLYKIIYICKNYIEMVGFDFEKCLEEKIKEIQSKIQTYAKLFEPNNTNLKEYDIDKINKRNLYIETRIRKHEMFAKNLQEAKEYIENFRDVDEYIAEIKNQKDYYDFVIKDYYIYEYERIERIFKLYEPNYIDAMLKRK